MRETMGAGVTKKRESFPASNEPLDNTPISNPELSPETKEALKRAEKVIGGKPPKSTFARNVEAMIKWLSPKKGKRS